MHKDIQQKYEKDQKERQIERNVSQVALEYARTIVFRHWKNRARILVKSREMDQKIKDIEREYKTLRDQG